MKTERVTFLTEPEFKAFLAAEAQRERLSLGELIRRRCERRPSDEEAVLASLTSELKKAVGDAKKSLKEGLREVRAVLDDLAAQRGEVAAGASARRARRLSRTRA